MTDLETHLLAVGCYTTPNHPAIRVHRWDPRDASLTPVAEHPGGENPTWLTRHPTLPIVYAVEEAREGSVGALALNPATGRLTEIDRRPTGGAGTCHLGIDPTGRLLAAANYGGGSLALFPLDEAGKIGAPLASIEYAGSGPHPRRQDRAHAHQALFSPDGRHLYLTDLGTDRVHVYTVDGTGLEEIAVVAVAPGAGPRHLAFDLAGDRAWLANELANTVTSFAVDGSGRLDERTTLPTLPAGFTAPSTVAAIRLDAAGERLYVSNRGHDSVAVYRVTGADLAPLGHFPVGAAQPRDIALDPTGRFLLAACQSGGAVTVLPLGGGIPDAPIGRHELPRPVCLLWL